MPEPKKMRCPMGVPGGIIAAIIGVVGIVISAIHHNWLALAFSAGLLLVAGPLARVTMMVHSALDRVEQLESAAKK
jgi:hypothetical protein